MRISDWSSDCALPIFLQLRADVQPGVEAMRLARRELDAGADGLRTVAASFARLGAVSHGFGRRRHDRGNEVMLQYRDPAAGLLCLERVLVELIECGLLELVAGAAGLGLLIEANAGEGVCKTRLAIRSEVGPNQSRVRTEDPQSGL